MKLAFTDWVKRFDSYGSSISLNYKGKKEHQTTQGAICTMIAFCFIAIYAIDRAIMLVTNSNAVAS